MNMMQESIHVYVPATTANLGSGFDAVGLALDFHDTLSFTLGQLDSDAVDVEIEGEGADTLPRDASHLVVKSFRDAARDLGMPMRELHLSARNRIPQARGMGSSAEAIVAGISAAYAFTHGGMLDRDYVFAAAAKVEGHPDNVAPAVYGGLTFSWKLEEGAEALGSQAEHASQGSESAGNTQVTGDLTAGYYTVRYPVSADIRAYVFVPDFALSTQDARNALPSQVPYHDAVANVSRVGLLPAALCPAFYGDSQGQTAIQGSGLNRNQLLFCATQDALHQQYRSALMPESAQLLRILRSKGLAATISGAGPCVLVLHSTDIEDELRSLSSSQLESGHWRLLPLAIDLAGVQVEQSL
jgi:homoserine kinase